MQNHNRGPGAIHGRGFFINAHNELYGLFLSITLYIRSGYIITFLRFLKIFIL